MENHDKYQKLTQKRDWEGIYKLNNLEFKVFGNKRALNALGDYLEPNETVYALVSGMSFESVTSAVTDIGPSKWLTVLTDERILFLDHALIRKSIDTQTIRINHVQAVAASQGFFFGKIAIDIGNRSIVNSLCVKTHVKTYAAIANKLIREKEGEQIENKPKHTSIADEIAKIAQLNKKGILTKAEFSKAKQKLISKL